MNLEPKILNNSNSRYGHKAYSDAWNASLRLVLGGGSFRSIKDYLDGGGYDQVIENALKHVKEFKTIGTLEDLDEANLASFFMLGEAYFKTGNTNKAIGAFHVVYSQTGFTQHMLDGPVDFAQYCDLAKAYLEEIAEKEGAEEVSNYDVESFLNNVVGKKDAAGKGSGGCFIATAVYESEFAPQVVTFRQFRDDVLLKSSIGKAFVYIYYSVSPPIARFLSKRRTLRKILMVTILDRLAKHLTKYD